MSPSWEALTVLVGLLSTMAAYALFAGADFGGGIWDLLAGRTEQGAEPRAEIDASVTPVWEGNQTWIVLGLVLLWTSFPQAFVAVMTTLFVPLSLSLLGLVLRGVGFGFRHESVTLRAQQTNGVLFGAASILAPFFLGVAVGAVATGRVASPARGDRPGAWLAPTPLLTGALFVATCAYIGAVYLVRDAHERQHPAMVTYFSRRALAAAVVSGLLAAADLGLLSHASPRLFHRLIGWPGLPLVLLSVLAGLAALALIIARRYVLLRVAAALAVIGVISAWGAAQYPWLLPRTLDIATGSAPPTALRSELAVLAMAAVLVVPAFAYLYRLQQRGLLEVTESSPELRAAVRAENAPSRAGSERPGRLVSVLAGVITAVALLGRLLGRARAESAPTER